MRGTTDEKEKCLEKLNEMQKFLPFLDFMIDKIKKKHVLPLECQLSKFQYIRSLIVEKNGRYSLEGLINIEEILQKLISKLDYKGLTPKDDKESSVVKEKSPSSKEVLAKTHNESAVLPSDYVSVTANSDSNEFTSNINDSPSGRVDVFIKSLSMSVGHSSQSDDKNSTNPTSGSSSSAVESTTKIGIADRECAEPKESTKCKEIVSQITVETESSLKICTASDVLAISRRKLLKSVSGKTHGTDNKKESDSKTVVCPDSSKSVESSVSDSTGKNCEPVCNDKKEKPSLFKNDSSKDLLSDVKEDGHIDNQKNPSNEKCTNPVKSSLLKKRKTSVDSCGVWDAITKAGTRYNDNFNIGSQPSYVFDFSSKQKLRERLSADIAEVHKVPGRSVGGSLRSLKDIKTSQECDLAKPDKTSGSHLSDLKRTSSKEKSDHRRSSYENKHGYPKKDSNNRDFNSGRKVSGRDSSREKWRHGKHGSDKKKSDTNHSSSKSGSVSNSSKEKRRKGKEKSEIDKLNDHELVAFVKENISSFPNLSKLKADELRRVARYSLSAEDYSSDEKSDVDVDESSEDKISSEQNLSREKSNIDSPRCSSPRTDDRVSEVNVDSVHLASAKDNDNATLNIEVRSEVENSKTLLEGSVYSSVSLLSSSQAESTSNLRFQELRIHEDLNTLEFRDQRLKHSLPIASDTRYIGNDNTRISNLVQKAEVNPTESSSSTRFSNLYNDKNTCDSRPWNVSASYENPYFNAPCIPAQGNDRFQKHESGSYDASGSTQRPYGVVSETTRFPSYNVCRNSNFSMPEPKSYREYKELKRQEKEIMNRFRLPHRDVSTSGEPTISEEELSENKNKLPVGFFGSKSVDDGKVKDSSKSSATAKTNDYRGTKVHGPKALAPKSSSKFRKALEEDKGANNDKSLVSTKSLVEDEPISPLDKLYDNHKPVTGRGYGLQNFKIPRKGKVVFCKNQKPQPHDQEPKIKQRLFYENRFDAETSAGKVTLEDEDKIVNKNSDRFADTVKPAEVKNVPQFHSTGNKVAHEEDAGKSDLKQENIVPDFNDSGRNGKDEIKNKAVIDGQSSRATEISTGEELVKNCSSENITEPKSAEGLHVQSTESDVYQKCSESEVSQDTSKLEKSLNSNTNVEELCNSSTDVKDRDAAVVESRNLEEKEEKDVEVANKKLITQEVTQELVEALIKKSFESGEDDLLLEKAKLLKELAFKLDSKKLRTIQKIINSESDSSGSSSDSSELSERKRKKKKKNDTGDTSEKSAKKTKQEKKTDKSSQYVDGSGSEVNKKPIKIDNIKSDKDDSSISNAEAVTIKKEVESPDKDFVASNGNTESIGQSLKKSPSLDAEMNGVGPAAPCEKEPEQKVKVKVKSKGKTELDRLHEDIRSMFITSNIVNASGQRMCRLLRESGGKMNNSDQVKESDKMTEEEKSASRKTGRRTFAQAKGIRSKNSDQRTLRDRSKTRKQVETESAKCPTSETSKNLDLDAVNLSNVVKSQPRVVLQRINLEKLSSAYKIGGLPDSYTRQTGMNTEKRGVSSASSTRSERESEISLTRKAKIYLLRNVRKYFAFKNGTVKKVYKPKKMSDVIKNLRAMNSRHSEFSGGDNLQKEETLRELLKPDGEPRKKENILRHNEILNYAFDRSKSYFFCLLCEHNTRAIAEHYVLKHPGSEVLISRLSINDAERAIQETELDIASENADNLGVTNGGMKSTFPKTCNYLCRMCNHGSSPNISQFFSHVSTHTGEYRFQCPVKGCGLPIANRDNVKSHVSWKHPESKHLADKVIELFPLPTYNRIVYGYLCSHCNYVQLLRKNTEAHILRQHEGIKDVKVIRIDMSRNREKVICKKRVLKRKSNTHDENKGTDAKELSTPNKDNRIKAQTGSDGNTHVRYRIISRDTSEGMQESCSSTHKVLEKETEDHGSGATRIPESETPNMDIQVEQQQDEDTIANDIIPVASENIILEEAVDMDMFDPSVPSCVGYEVDVPIDDMEQANCFEIMQTEEDIVMGNELVEEVVLSMDGCEVPEILVADEVPDPAAGKCWEVGPLKAFIAESEIVYTCTGSECQFSSTAFKDLEDHISTSHNGETWSGVCKTCNDFPDSKVERLDDVVEIHQILKHLECHIKADIDEDGTVKNAGSDNVIVYENQLLETIENDEFDPMTIEAILEEEPDLSMEPVLRVRSLTGDRLSKPKTFSEDECSSSETPSSVSDAFVDDEKDTTEPLFTIKDVRSLDPESKDDPSSDTVFAPMNKAVQTCASNEEVVSGKPVLVRSCPSPKITILPETSNTPIPVAQVSQDVEARRLKVVPILSNAESSDGQQQEFVTSPTIRIVSPGTFTSQTVQPTFTTPTLTVVKSKVPDSVVIQNKKQGPNPIVKKPPLGSGLPTKEVQITTAEGIIIKKKKSTVAPPLISITKPILSLPQRESVPPSQHQIPPKPQQLYSISFGGKNIKDKRIYTEMLTRKKLCQLFKCMAVECSFTCNGDGVFTQHLGLHEAQQRIKGKKRPQAKFRKIYNWQQCAYCCEVLVHTSHALSQHILAEHGHCLYQCAYCFYRAVSEIYVDIHQKTVHDSLLKGQKKVVYKCRPVKGAAASKQFEKHVKPHNLRPFHCEICGCKFFIIKHFYDHLTKHHLAVTAYACHICKIVCFKPDRLITHYRLHSYGMFQCSYCLHGTETQKDMLLHLCNFHFSLPPILYARVAEDMPSGNVIFDDLKLINLENERCNLDCVVEEVDPAEYEIDNEDIQPLPISGDLSAIVSELGINIEDGVTSNISPPQKIIMDVDTDFSRLVPVETILPNAKFSSDSDNICEENTSLIIGSEFTTRRSSREENESVSPAGQVPIELLTLGAQDQSSSPEATSVLEHLASIEAGIQKLQQNNCEVIISPAPEKRSVDEMPSRSMHKLPPTIPINRSGVTNIYQSKKNVTKKLETIPKQVKHNVPALLKCLGTSQKISPDKSQQKNILIPYSAADDVSAKKKKDTARIPAIQTVVGLKRQGSERDLKGDICESNLAKKPRRSSGPISSLMALNSSRQGPLMISDVRSLSTENATLQPPIIRVEDFANDEKGNLVRKKEGLSIELRKGPSDSRKGGNPISETPSYYPGLSPDVVIINLDNSQNNPRGECAEGEHSGDTVEQSKNIGMRDREQNKLEIDDEEDDGDVEEEAEEEEMDMEENLEIRKEMEQLRSDIGNETDCLLLEVPTRENDPMICSDTSDSSKVDFSTDGETMNSFNEGSQSENVDNGETMDNPSEKQVREIPEKVTEINKRSRNETSSDEGKEDETVSETQEKTANKAKISQVQKKPKISPLKAKELTGKDLYLCGIANCNFAADNHKELKDHVCVCDFSRDSSVLSCPHCSRQFKQSMSYVDHLQTHGEKKYSCGLCSFCSTTESNVNRHLKQKHKCSQTKALPNDSFKPGYFIVYPKNYKVERRSDMMNVYSPGDEDKLPLQSIYQENVKCSQCPYFTKVRSNMVRHLKIHIKSAETEGSIVVPKTAPTNPVPCLEAKERMFDKMANLAASSQLAHANKDKKDTLPPEEKAKFPQFVPEQMRYKCCSPDCNYLTVDDNMLKHHIKALHNEVNIYSCPHCKESVPVEFRFTSLDKLGQHLKYHDSKLYKCCHCLYFHYQKYVVEKHLLEKHPERRFFVYTIREPKTESTSEEQQPSSAESALKWWKCGFCDEFERSARSDVVEHLVKIHNMKSKFKCKYCDMKSSQYSSFVSHFASKHHGLKVECVRSIVQVNRTCSEGSQSSASQDYSNEYFDTTPLWQRDAPRVRHIRGILIEEEEVKKKKIKKVESVENGAATTSSYPLDSFYCPLCADKKKLFRTRNAEMFRNHLYQELNYQQFACTLCGKMFVDKKEYERHHLRCHPNKIPGFKQTKEDTEIKFWVEKVVLKQEMQLKERKRKITSEGGGTQSSKKKKVLMEEDKEITTDKTEGNKPGPSCPSSETESKSRGKVSAEKSDCVRLKRCGSAAEEDSGVGQRPDTKCELSEEKAGGKEEPKWLCHYCKDFFQTEDEVVTHCKNKHPDNPVKAMFVPEETVEPLDDLWFIEFTQGVDSDDNSSEDSDGTTKKKSRKGSSYSCGYCMVEVTDQTSIVNHFETCHKSEHSSARMGMINTIYYRCNVCLEKLFTFSCLSVHGMERHPNMTLQFEIRKIYDRDAKAKPSEAAKAASVEVKDGSYQCPRCSAISSSYLDCIDHFNEHYPRYTCRSCNIRYYTVEEMENHQDETRHPKPYAMTIPSERMLDEYKAGIRIKKDGAWVPLQEHAKSEVTDRGTEVKRPKMTTARKSITRIPERRSNGDEASAAKFKNTPSQ